MSKLRLVPKMERGYEGASWRVAWFAGIIIVALMFLTLGSMVSRNLRLCDVATWCSEITYILVLWTFLLPMVYSQFSGGMVRVTFFVERVPGKFRPWFEMFSSGTAVLISASLLYASVRFLLATSPGTFYPESGLPVLVERMVTPLGSLLLLGAGLICVRRDISALRARSARISSGRNCQKPTADYEIQHGVE